MATQGWMVAKEKKMKEQTASDIEGQEEEAREFPGILMNRKRRRAEDAKNRRAEKAVDKRVRHMRRFLSSTEVAIKGLQKSFDALHRDFPCLEFQRIRSDLYSVAEHLETLRTNGPSEPHRETPLEDSELTPPPIPEDARAPQAEIQGGTEA